MEMAEVAALLEPYVPAPTYFEDSDMIEYVTADIPTIVRQIDENFAVLVSVDDRTQIVGFQLYAPKRAFAAPPQS